MSLAMTGNARLLTGSNQLTSNVSKCSIMGFVRLDGNPARFGGKFLLARNYYSGFSIVGKNSTSGKFLLLFAWFTPAGRVDYILECLPGETTHFAWTWDNGVQMFYRDGVPVRIGSLTGPTTGGSQPLMIGGWDPPTGVNLECTSTLHDLSVCNDYALTPEDVAAHRDGIKTPLEILPGFALKAWWKLNGTPGQPVTLNQGGLANAFATGSNFTGSDGVVGGPAYSSPLDWSPSAVAVPYVATSGESIGFSFMSKSTGKNVIPTGINFMPTVMKNGIPMGPLRDPWVTKYCDSALISLTKGETISPADDITISAPAGWMSTEVGLSAKLDNQLVANEAKASNFGSDLLKKKMIVGVNISPNDTTVEPFQVLANLARRHDNFINATHDAKGYPTYFPSASHIASIMFAGDPCAIDDTGYPGPLGLHAIRWDELDPAHPTTFDFAPDEGYGTADANVTFVERLDLANPGTLVDGVVVGIVRVFDIRATPGTKKAKRCVRVRATHANHKPMYRNLIVHGPKDFTWKDNTPTVIEVGDPSRPSNVMLERLEGVGLLRWVEPLTENAGGSPMSEPEHLYNEDDYRIGFGRNSYYARLGIKQARPLDLARTPYVYSSSVGDQYDVKLYEDVTAEATSVKVLYDPANPVFAKLRLFADTEVLRVDSVAGSLTPGSVVVCNVTRGCESTKPGAHAAGTIKAGYRIKIGSFGNLSLAIGLVLEVVSTAPHGLWSGAQIGWSGVWPTFTFTDGRKLNASEWSANAWVTGPDTIAFGLYSSNTTPANLSTTYDLDPAKCYSDVSIPRGGSLMPHEIAAHVTGQFEDCDMVLNIPYAASNDLVIEIARRVRDHLPAGRRVHVELCNEVWNWGFPQFRFFTPLSNMLGIGQGDCYPSYVERASKIWQLIETVFGEQGRAGEIVRYVGVNPRPGDSLTKLLDYAAAHVPPIRIDMVKVAPYIEIPEWGGDTETKICQNRYSTAQCIDLYIHCLRTNVGDGSYPRSFADTSARIGVYNAKTGFDCKLGGYEGGVEKPIAAAQVGPGSVSVTNGLRAVTGSGSNFQKLFRPGDTILITSTLGVPAPFKVLAVADNTHLTLETGYPGTTGSGLPYQMRVDNWLEKAYDMVTHPLWRVAEHDMLGMCEEGGMESIVLYRYSGTRYKGVYMWPIYDWIGQEAGLGDGSDGKLNNLLCLAEPGLPGSKLPTDSKLQGCVSVRGQALKDWNKEVRAGMKKTVECPDCHGAGTVTVQGHQHDA
jgi:hypothetical protein